MKIPLFDRFKEEFAGIKKTKGDLQQQLEKLKRRRDEIRNAPLCKSDVSIESDRWVDAMGLDYPARLQHVLSPVIHKTTLAGVNPAHLQARNLLGAGRHAGIPADIASFQENLCFFFADAVKAGLRLAISKMDIPEGPTLVERQAEEVNLSKQIADLEAELEKIVSQARTLIKEIAD